MRIPQKAYNSILLRSAKKRLDYLLLSRRFGCNADYIILKLLNDLADLRANEDIAKDIQEDLLKKGSNWPIECLSDFIEEQEQTFRLEISINLLLTDMKVLGYDDKHILDVVSKACGGLKPLYVVD